MNDGDFIGWLVMHILLLTVDKDCIVPVTGKNNTACGAEQGLKTAVNQI